MATSVTLAGLGGYGTLSGNQLSNSVGVNAGATCTLSSSGSSLAIGDTASLTVTGVGLAETVSVIYEGYIFNNGIEDPVLLMTGSQPSYVVIGYSGTANQTDYALPYTYPAPVSSYDSPLYPSFAEYTGFSGGVLSGFGGVFLDAQFELQSSSASVGNCSPLLASRLAA